MLSDFTPRAAPEKMKLSVYGVHSGEEDMPKLFEPVKTLPLVTAAICCLLNSCALTEKTVGKDPELAAAVVRLYEIGQREQATGVKGFPSLPNTEKEVVSALTLGGGKHDYLRMDDFTAVLQKYEKQFGRDKFFIGAARLADSYSDGEYGLFFEKSYPDLRARFQKEAEDRYLSEQANRKNDSPRQP